MGFFKKKKNNKLKTFQSSESISSLEDENGSVLQIEFWKYFCKKKVALAEGGRSSLKVGIESPVT